MNMKKYFAAILFSVLSAFVFSAELSFFLGDNTDLKFDSEEYSEPTLKQSEAFSALAKIPFNKRGTSFLSLEASISHSYEKIFGDHENSENEFIADLNVLKFSSIMECSAGKFFLDAGRLFLTDISQTIFAQSIDGAYAQFSASWLDVSVFGGYTGLLNLKNTSIMHSGGYVWEPVDEDEKDFYDFCAPYIAGGAKISFPYLLLNQTISLEGLGFWNTEGPADSPEDEDNRFYGTLRLDGPLAPMLFYGLSGTASSTDFSDFGFLGRANISLFPDFKSSSITLSASYASGDRGPFVPFIGFTQITACLSADEPIYSGISKAGLSATIIPIDKLYCAVGGDAVFVDNDSSAFDYCGFQVYGNAKYQLFSDVALTLYASHFAGDSSDSSRTEIAFNAVISF
ncbi:hypothetical protein [uncultured Treponema sp.]|uniref:hypothetical protein n=2 Tax=uncultured Treponema sp. TaxID=162155 RepID=UPI00280ADFC7|nr:hypothetical protein [uncultured Treponema sp.]